ncbi:hypothetical protein TNCT6_63390 [Streptomyces sp. 6-11-2]|nr:hypothetical protein TNCT6_63390 [Streptomyces sp. 6-11-2]
MPESTPGLLLAVPIAPASAAAVPAHVIRAAPARAAAAVILILMENSCRSKNTGVPTVRVPGAAEHRSTAECSRTVSLTGRDMLRTGKAARVTPRRER